MIVKYMEPLHNGIQTQVLARYAIGYILRGTKNIYDGDKPSPAATSFTWVSATTTPKTVPKADNPSNRSSSTIRPRSCRRFSCT